MTALFMIIGGAAGGVLGWLFDRAAAKRGTADSQTASGDACETSS